MLLGVCAIIAGLLSKMVNLEQKKEKLREVLDLLIDWQTQPLNAAQWQAIISVQNAIEDLIAVIGWEKDA
jgi:hypothetical protein